MKHAFEKSSARTSRQVFVASTADACADSTGSFFCTEDITALKEPVAHPITNRAGHEFEKAVISVNPGAAPGSFRPELDRGPIAYEAIALPSELRKLSATDLLAEPVGGVKSHPEEEWRPCSGFPGYEASSLGRIRHGRGLVRQSLSGGRYWTVWLRLTGKREYVHAMVASAFLGPRANGDQVDHLNANKRDNRPQNLEWVTHAENIRRGPQSKLTEEAVRCLRDEFSKLPRRVGRVRPTVGSTEFIRRKAAELGVAMITVNRVVYGYQWVAAITAQSACPAQEAAR